jgi:hypothetical protein
MHSNDETSVHSNAMTVFKSVHHNELGDHEHYEREREREREHDRFDQMSFATSSLPTHSISAQPNAWLYHSGFAFACIHCGGA